MKKLTINNPNNPKELEWFETAALNEIAKFGESVDIFITPSKAKRSLNQLKYYWAVVVKAVSFHTGYTPEEIHLYNKHKFGLRITKEIAGEIIEEVKGTKVGRKEMSDFIARVIQFWSEQTGLEFGIEPTEEEWIEGQQIES